MNDAILLLTFLIRYKQLITKKLKGKFSQQKTMSQQNNGFITQEGLRKLDNYKYVSGGYTKLDQIMNPFWEKTVSLVPLTVAPNTITLIGALLVIISQVVMLCHATTLDEDIPSWCFLFNAIAIFLYQTLDAIDGKQARRTKSSSPLGQLFDHGCDSFTMGFIILGICHAGRINGLSAASLLISSQFLFWTSNWAQHHTGILNTKYGQFGVTEAQLLAVFIHLITAVFGQDFWGVKLQTVAFFTEVPPVLTGITFVNFLAVAISVISFLFTTIGILVIVFAQKNSENAHKSHSVSKIQMLKQHTTVIILFVLELFWVDFKVYQKYEALILLNFGALLSLLVCKTIISSTTKMQLKGLHNEVIYFLFFTMLISLFDIVGQYQAMEATFGLCLAINILRIGTFVKGVIEQITNHLGIFCFSLGKRNQKFNTDFAK